MLVPLGSLLAVLAAVPAAIHEELLADRADIDLRLIDSQRPAPLWLERSRINRELGAWSAAMHDLGHAAEQGAPRGVVERGRAEIHLARGDGERTVAAANAALEANADDSEALVLRARGWSMLGRFQVAADDFGQAVAIGVRHPLDLVCERARTLARIPGEGTGLALELIEGEVERRGPLPSLLLVALDFEREAGAWDAALARLDQLRRQGWSPARYGLVSGEVLLAKGEREVAVLRWREALDELDRLPPRRRTTRAALRMRTDLRRHLAGLTKEESPR